MEKCCRCPNSGMFSSLGKTDWIEHVSFKKFRFHQSVDGSVLPGFFPLGMAGGRIGWKQNV